MRKKEAYSGESRDGSWYPQRRTYLEMIAGLGVALSGCITGGGPGVVEREGTPLPSATARNALLGASVATDGDTAIVGATHTDRNQDIDVDTQVAFVFSRVGEGWTGEAILRPGRPAAGFGESVALAGDTALVAAREDSRQNPESTEVNGEPEAETGESMGAVFVFARSSEGWTRETTLTPNDAGSEDKFGHSIAMDGDTVVVGAWLDEDPNGGEGGSAYVFEQTTDGWTQQAKLAGDHQDAHFGTAVAVDGDTAVICANQDRTPKGPDEGSAYVFVRTGEGWTRETKLFVEHKLNGAVLGESVAIDGDTAFVGAPRENTMYVFSRSGEEWTKQAELYPDDVEQREGLDPGDSFAGSVTLSNEVALIGAPTQDDEGASRAGSVYVFTRAENGWLKQSKFTAGDGDSRDAFGRSVSLGGDTAFVTAPNDEDPEGAFAGAAYAFARPSGTWEQQAKLTVGDGGPFEPVTGTPQSSSLPSETKIPSSGNTTEPT